MCVVYRIDGQSITIDCPLVNPFWWYRGVIDLDSGIFVHGKPDIPRNPFPEPDPFPWLKELTVIGNLLAAIGNFSDPALADNLAAAAIDAAESIAEKAELDVHFTWTPHREQQPVRATQA